MRTEEISARPRVVTHAFERGMGRVARGRWRPWRRGGGASATRSSVGEGGASGARESDAGGDVALRVRGGWHRRSRIPRGAGGVRATHAAPCDPRRGRATVTARRSARQGDGGPAPDVARRLSPRLPRLCASGPNACPSSSAIEERALGERVRSRVARGASRRSRPRPMLIRVELAPERARRDLLRDARERARPGARTAFERFRGSRPAASTHPRHARATARRRRERSPRGRSKARRRRRPHLRPRPP